MILAIRRAPRFSPNSVEKDAKILECVCNELRQKGFQVTDVNEEELHNIQHEHEKWDICLSMGRLPQTIEWLKEEEKKGCIVINSSKGVALCCNRRKLTEALTEADIPVPSEKGCDGYWLKRGNGVAETHGDVRFAHDEKEKEQVMAQMKADGIDDIVISAHVKGDLVKFYGVKDSGFFRIFYPGADGQSKFGDEHKNGAPHYYNFCQDKLHDTAEQAAKTSDTTVYGGDCIIRQDGSFYIIDFNDWPSFARCREEAAKAIAQAVERYTTKETNL